MQPIKIAQAKARFSELVARAEAGEEIIISKRGKAVARLVPEPERFRSVADVLQESWALGGFDFDEVSEPEIPPDDIRVD